MGVRVKMLDKRIQDTAEQRKKEAKCLAETVALAWVALGTSEQRSWPKETQAMTPEEAEQKKTVELSTMLLAC